MSYRVKRGMFAIGIINSGEDTGAQTLTKLTIDEVRTSAGLFHTTKIFIENGLAFSDVYFYDAGGGSPNLNPRGGHCPSTDGGFGSDIIDGYSNWMVAGAVGCAVYENSELSIYYHDQADENHSVDSSICVVL